MSIRIPKRVIFVLLLLVLSITSIVVFGQNNENSTKSNTTKIVDTATVNVKAGYYPAEIILPANKETAITFITENTYDCSAALLIPKLQIEQFLPPTGSTQIDIKPQTSGTEIIAGCSMGMYTFKIKFL